ncbi:MAG: MaoC/PaaZ C-terminal domain-containing protein [Actinomycetes bacterium]
MSAQVRYADVVAGMLLPSATFRVTREDLVRYAGASGDFNVIHWNQRRAREVGLPDVIAHGMLTMALAARVVTDWAGDPAALVEYSVRFTRPVVVPDDDHGALVEVRAEVTQLLAARRIQVTVTATSAGEKALGQARALVLLG